MTSVEWHDVWVGIQLVAFMAAVLVFMWIIGDNPDRKDDDQ